MQDCLLEVLRVRGQRETRGDVDVFASFEGEGVDWGSFRCRMLLADGPARLIDEVKVGKCYRASRLICGLLATLTSDLQFVLGRRRNR